MTELHLALLLLAAALLLALYLYGKWQERKAVRRLDASLRQGIGDPLGSTAGSSAGPSAGVSVEATAGPSAAVSARRVEPRFAVDGEEADRAAEGKALDNATEGSALRVEPSAYGLADGWIEDPMLDFVLELRCAHPIDGVTALEARAQLDRLALSLPTHLAVWDARAQQWTSPDRFGFYSDLLLATQLANRRGGLGEIDAARFVAAAQQIAVMTEADTDGPDMVRLLAQAAELDRLCARFDVQITLTLESLSAPWSAAALEGAAQQTELSPAGALRWEARAAGARALVLFAKEAPTRQASLVLDVPLARADASALGRLFSTASRLAVQLGAQLVDDNGRAVQAEAQGAIETQLAQLRAEMSAAGIEPGSLRAQRLYSD